MPLFPSSFVGDKFEISRKKGMSVRDYGGAAGDMVVDNKAQNLHSENALI